MHMVETILWWHGDNAGEKLQDLALPCLHELFALKEHDMFDPSSATEATNIPERLLRCDGIKRHHTGTVAPCCAA